MSVNIVKRLREYCKRSLKFRMKALIFQNSNENIVRISALKVFIAFLGLPGSFLGFPEGFLINDITY